MWIIIIVRSVQINWWWSGRSLVAGNDFRVGTQNAHFGGPFEYIVHLDNSNFHFPIPCVCVWIMADWLTGISNGRVEKSDRQISINCLNLNWNIIKVKTILEFTLFRVSTEQCAHHWKKSSCFGSVQLHFEMDPSRYRPISLHLMVFNRNTSYCAMCNWSVCQTQTFISPAECAIGRFCLPHPERRGAWSIDAPNITTGIIQTIFTISFYI